MSGDDLQVHNSGDSNNAIQLTGSTKVSLVAIVNVGAPLAAPAFSFSAHRTMKVHTRTSTTLSAPVCMNPAVTERSRSVVALRFTRRSLSEVEAVGVACKNNLQFNAALKKAA